MDRAIVMAARGAGILSCVLLALFCFGEIDALARPCGLLAPEASVPRTDEIDQLCHNVDVRVTLLEFMSVIGCGAIGYGVSRFISGVVFWRDPEAKSKT